MAKKAAQACLLSLLGTNDRAPAAYSFVSGEVFSWSLLALESVSDSVASSGTVEVAAVLTFLAVLRRDFLFALVLAGAAVTEGGYAGQSRNGKGLSCWLYPTYSNI